MVQGETDKTAVNIQTRSLMARTWRRMSKNAKLKEKQKWSIEKQKLDNARRLRGIYFIDPEDMEFKETTKNARKKLATPMPPAMPCKIIKSNKNFGSGAYNKIKTKLACILETSASTRVRIGNSIPSNHEDHIAGKGNNSLQHYNLVARKLAKSVLKLKEKQQFSCHLRKIGASLHQR